MRYEFNRPPVRPPSGNAAHMTVTNVARNRAGFRGQRDKARRRTAQTQSCQYSEGDQHRNRGGERGQDGENADQHGRNDQQLLATEAIGQRPECGGPEGCPDQRRRKNPLEIGDLDAEFVGNERCRDPDRLRIRSVEQIDQRAADNDADLEPRQRPVVDQPGDVDFAALVRRVGHGRFHNFACKSRTKAESPICRSRLSRSAARIARTSANASFLSRLTMT